MNLMTIIIQIPQTTPPKSQQQNRSSAGDYEFTHCPAYVPVTHGNQQTETLLRQQPTTGSGNVTEGDHEYEVLDKYSQPYVNVLIPITSLKSEQQMTSSAGDYEFTRCPAYVPVRSTHGYKTD